MRVVHVCVCVCLQMRAFVAYFETVVQRGKKLLLAVASCGSGGSGRVE